MSSSPDPNLRGADKPPKVRLAKGQEVSLGCGTLILIAVIVLMFGRAGTGDLEHEVRELRSEVGAMKKAVDFQTGQIKALNDNLETAKGKE